MFSNGFDRRFGSSSITSQYDLQANVTNEQKNQIKKSDAYKNLSKEDQTKLLDRMDADSKAIAGYKAKVEQGRESEIKKTYQQDKSKYFLASLALIYIRATAS